MDIFVEISVLLVIAALVSMVMRALRQPLIIGYIITGLIVGPALMGIVGPQEMLEVFSKFGIALLLFIVGLGLNIRVIKEVGKVSLITGILEVMLSTLLGFMLGRLLGFGLVESLYVAVALSFSSTIIIVKLLSDKKDQNKLYGKISIGLLLVEDVMATFALLAASATATEGISYAELMGLAGKGIVLVVAVLLFVKYVLTPMNGFLARSSELLFLFAMAWGFGIASLTYLGGFSLEVGALLAGVALASMPYAQEVASRLRPLRDFFLIVFFISLGSTLVLDNLSHTLWVALVLSAFVILVRPILVMVLMSIQGYTRKTSFRTGLSLAQISEFSIIFILLGHQNKQIPDDIVQIFMLVALITIAVSSYMLTYSGSMYARIAKVIPIFRDSSAKREHEKHHKVNLVLFGYHHGGFEFIRVFKEMRKKYLVVDYDPEIIELLERNNIPHMYGDAGDADLLEEVGLERVDLVASTITDLETTKFLVKSLRASNPDAVCIVRADRRTEAEQLYELGASYVMLPHYIGSERMGAFIRKYGTDKDAFRKFGEQHQKDLKPALH